MIFSVTSTAIANRLMSVLVGGQPMKEIWEHNGSAWRCLYRKLQAYQSTAFQRGVTPNNQTWTTIATYPPVVGDGPGSLSLAFYWGSNGLQFVSRQRRFRLMRNGQMIGAEQVQNHTTGGWQSTYTITENLLHGDVITVQAWANDSYEACRTMTADSFNITPFF